MFKISSRFLISLFALLAAATFVYASAVPTEKRDAEAEKRQLIPANICSAIGILDVDNALTALNAVSASIDGVSLTPLVQDLVTGLDVCANGLAVVGVVAGLSGVVSLLVGLVEAIVAALLRFDLTTIISIIASVKLDISLSAVVNIVSGILPGTGGLLGASLPLSTLTGLVSLVLNLVLGLLDLSVLLQTILGIL
ncbi:hypothetical protein SISNIDRAFT_461619 [Sistotremastrum niveocremeum HHB9708]|uniref:Uncharacterized protein n=2 Tax=Sistotremastraceae TaxID=3402574 RepID=A0A164MEF0_9AGAM|nr:hypothetical protein SISNIDRAFT_461619 [Sistotremastrum niveocremeum HHB9708]KZT34614.1 hypothetical protein SISSUDRAFT_1052549 [Sistotremastrum suecicum HHB10207 ss-3]